MVIKLLQGVVLGIEAIPVEEGVRHVVQHSLMRMIRNTFCNVPTPVVRRSERIYSRSLQRLATNGKLVPVYELYSWMVSKFGSSVPTLRHINWKW